MIFQSLTIQNLFSYYGENCFDLTPSARAEGNIVIIMGRNGYGKTSFLNSVKLLFGGVTKELMAGVQRGTPLQQKSFVQGNKDWWGILNHKARANGTTLCSVSAILLDEHGQETKVSRSWDLRDDKYNGRLNVSAPRMPPLSGDDAHLYLSSLLPLDYIPFFFFDAEEVGYLAEANRNQTIEKMEQLLNIRPVDNMKECLSDIRKEWSRNALDLKTKKDLLKAEHSYDELQLSVSNLKQERERVDGRVDELEDAIHQLQRNVQLLRGTGTIENSARLQAEKQKEEERLAEALSALSTAFEHDALLRVNPQLAKKAMIVAESCAASRNNATSELLGSLRGPLSDVFTTPPYPDSRLTDSQVRFYQTRICKLLDARDVACDQESLFQIETGRAKRLAAFLATYQQEHRPTDALFEQLERAQNADQASTKADNELQNVRQLSDDDKIRLEQLQHDLDEKENDLLNQRDQARSIDHELAIARREIGPLEKQIESLREKAKQSAAARARLNLLEQMRRLLVAYKQKLREEMRGALETAFNKHIKQLLDSNTLVQRTRIDEFFQLSYRDAADHEIAMSSLSAGMKQLAATALLWALKDASGSHLPVIIDTPLGRIDRSHQDNLLTRYYPHASQQVILLPTDSELDERKSRLLAPHIYRTFHLNNPSGEETSFELIEPTPEAAHG